MSVAFIHYTTWLFIGDFQTYFLAKTINNAMQDVSLVMKTSFITATFFNTSIEIYLDQENKVFFSLPVNVTLDFLSGDERCHEKYLIELSTQPTLSQLKIQLTSYTQTFYKPCRTDETAGPTQLWPLCAAMTFLPICEYVDIGEYLTNIFCQASITPVPPHSV